MSQVNERLIQQQLERQSRDIESTLRFHKVQVRVTGGEVSPRWTSYDLQLPLGQRVNRVMNLSDELALALEVSDVRIHRRGGRLQIQVPRENGRRVSLADLLESQASETFPPVTATLGVAESGRPLLLRMPSPDVAHVMIAGTTGSGKTALLRTIALSLAWGTPSAGCSSSPSTPKGGGWRRWPRCPTVSRT